MRARVLHLDRYAGESERRVLRNAHIIRPYRGDWLWIYRDAKRIDCCVNRGRGSRVLFFGGRDGISGELELEEEDDDARVERTLCRKRGDE